MFGRPDVRAEGAGPALRFNCEADDKPVCFAGRCHAGRNPLERMAAHAAAANDRDYSFSGWRLREFEAIAFVVSDLYR